MSFKEWIDKLLYGKEPHHVDHFHNIEPIVQDNVRRYVIPVGGLTRKEAVDKILELMKSYNEDVKWDGELNIESKLDKDFDPHVYNKCGPHHPRRVFTIPIGKKL